MNSLPRARRLLSLVLVSIACSAARLPVHAQSAPARATPPPAATDDVVLLSPFTVNNAADVGYQAQNTLAGSRLNSSLKDTPNVLDVLTKEFLDDIGALSLEQALNFSANYETDWGDLDGFANVNRASYPNPNQSLNFQTRGHGGKLARNFLETSFRPQFYTIERIDSSSGPNAILAGIGSAGGVVNVTTKRAGVSRDAYGVEFNYDSNFGRRGVVDVNKVILADRLGLRVNFIRNRGRTHRPFSADKLNGVHLAGTWRLTARTELRAEYEHDRTTGTVDQPGAGWEKISQWLAAGARTFTVPTNWESLSNAARTAVFNTYVPGGIAGINLNSSNDQPIYVAGPQPYIFNARNSLVTVGAPTRSTDKALLPSDMNTFGPGALKEINSRILALALDHRLARDLFVTVAASRESGNARTYQSFPGNRSVGETALTADPNATISYAGQILNPGAQAFSTNASGQTVNPHAGEFYFDGRWALRSSESARETAQATLAWKMDLKRWGSHNIVSNVSYSETDGMSASSPEVWLGAPFNRNPTAGANSVIRRFYATPGDVSTYHAAVWWDSQNLAWNHPTRGVLTSGYLPSEISKTPERDKSALVALQSAWLGRRLVTTLGYRTDERAAYQYLPHNILPPGYEGSNGYPVIDRDSVIDKTVTRGETKTVGAVFHVTKWASVYGNFSDSFAPGSGLPFGPDGLAGPQQEGRGKDIGLKFGLLENKAALDVGYFSTTTVNANTRFNVQLRGASSMAGTWEHIFSALDSPINGPRLLNTSDPAALAAMQASYPALRSVWRAGADLYDKSSTGYEARLVANPARGLRLRATYAQTEVEKENLMKYTVVARDQLKAYIDELKAKNSGVNVGGLTADQADNTIDQDLKLFDELMQEAIDFNSNAFGSSKHRFNFFAGYDLPGRLKGWSTGVGAIYQSGRVVGSYHIIDPAAPRVLIQEIPIFGPSNIDWTGMLRYSTRVTWLGRRNKLTLQVNVRNLLDRQRPEPRRYDTLVVAPGAPLPTPAAPTLIFLRAPRVWTLTAKLDL